MRFPLPMLVFLLTGFSGGLCSQEVITNENGEKIVVDANGDWRYFRSDSAGVVAKFTLPEKVADRRDKRLKEAENLEKELSLSIIKKRVELTDLQIEIQQGTVVGINEKKARLQQLKQKIAELKAELESTRQRLDFLEEINNLPAQTYARQLKKWENDHRPSKVEKELTYTASEGNPTVAKATNSIANGILFLPPPTPCEPGSLTVDEASQKRKWETSACRLFSHTDGKMQGQYLKRDFIACKGFLVAMEGGLKYLKLEISIASVNAPQIFGQMPKDEFLEIQLLNGERLTFFNSLQSNGQWVPSQDAFVYQAMYPLGNKEEKTLRSSDLDTVTVRWSKVQEKFEVYRTDFFIRHFTCLDAMLSSKIN